MPLSIKHPEAERLARELAERAHDSLTNVIIKALRESLLREEGRSGAPTVLEELEAIRHRCAALPVIDSRSPDEILGYDEHGLPH